MLGRSRLHIFHLINTGTACLLIILSQSTKSVPLDGFHQLCRKFEWVGDPLITQLAPSSPFSKCINIKPHPVPKSDILYVTVSATVHRACTEFRIEAVVLTLVTLPHPPTSTNKGIATGVWSKISPNREQLIVPAQFPTLYLNNSRYLSTAECSRDVNEEYEYPFYQSNGTTTNSLVYRGHLSQGEGFVAKVQLNNPTKYPAPVQIKAEILVRKGPREILKYWIYEGNMGLFLYVPETVTIKSLPGEGSISLDSSYYTDKITIRTRRQGATPPPPPPPLRKTHMCACVSPRRQGGVSQDPNDDIKELPDGGDPLNGCFELKLASCPSSVTKEKFGAIFIQKRQCSIPDVKVLDISFIALNENGYPYGELEVNILTRPCFKDASGANGVISFLPVIHDQKPVKYSCPNLPENQTLYTLPKWLSLEPDLQVGAADKPRVIQVMFLEKIKQAGNTPPTSIQIVAEFSVDLGNSTQELRRIKSESRNLAFTGSDEIDWARTSPLQPPIVASPDYLHETNGLTCPGKPQSCQNCPKYINDALLCRKIEAESKSLTSPSSQIESCMNTAFIYDPSGKKFFASLELLAGSMSCKNYSITQVVFIVLERNATGTRISGSWETNTGLDFVVGKCKKANSVAKGLHLSLKRDVESCIVKDIDQQLYHFSKNVTDKMVCGKWTHSASSSQVLEIQAGVKVLFSDGKDNFTHIVRIPEMYDIVKGPSSKTETVSQSRNTRIDILWKTRPPSEQTEPPLIRLSPRQSQMCQCVLPRRQNGHQINPKLLNISESFPDSLKSCFDFKLSNCPGSHTEELLGAVFVFKGVDQGCPEGVKLVDISVIAINHNGFPYGRLESNKNIKMCFDSNNPYSNVLVMKPILTELNTISYNCTDYTFETAQTLYSNPSWISVNADVVNEKDPPFKGFQGAIFQFVLNDTVKSGSSSIPSPTALQFIAEFGVVENGTYHIYRKRTEQRKLAFGSNGKVNFAGSSIQAGNIELHGDYIDENTVNCVAPQANPSSSLGPPKDSMCICLDKCKPCGGPDPEIEKCFTVVFNHESNSNPPVFYMSLRKNNAGNECPNAKDIIIHDVLFAALKRQSGQFESEVVGEWSVIEENDQAKYSTVGSCLDKMATGLNPKMSPRFSTKDCKGGSKSYSKGVFWHYRKFEMPNDIVCAKMSVTPTKQHELQASYKVLYSINSTSGGGPIKEFKKAHFKIFEVDTSKTVLLYDKNNSRVILQLFENFSSPCVLAPSSRPTQMCRCYNPQSNVGPTFPPIMELSEDKTGLDKCFELKMADCSDGHTNERLGVLFKQSGEATTCNKKGIQTLDMTIVAVNEIGYPYGELEVAKTAGACLDVSGGPNPILSHRPILTYLYPDSYPCNKDIYKPERSKYGNTSSTFLALKLDLISNSNGTNPQTIQVLLKEAIKTASNPGPISLQFIVEFTMRESTNGPIKAFRIVSEHRKIGFSGNQASLASSPIVQNVPRIELHPDYGDADVPTCDSSKTSTPLPQPPPMDWTTCHCFFWEEAVGEGEKPSDVQVKLLTDCFAVSFLHNYGTTFFASVAKRPPSSAPQKCGEVQVQQFVLTVLGRDETGFSTTMAVEGLWSLAAVPQDYVSGRCLPMGANAGEYNGQKTAMTSTKGCSRDAQPPTSALYFYYRFLKRPGDVHCGKWEVNTTSKFQEVQLLYKIQFYEVAKPFIKYKYTGRHPLMYDVRGTIVKPISVEKDKNYRINIYHTNNPNPSPKPNCLQTPFVPTSDICDCTPTRQGSFQQIPDKTLVEDFHHAVPPLSKDCFEFKMTPCTIEGDTFNTIGAVLTVKSPVTTPTCKDNILVEDVSFQALNDAGFPVGEPRYSRYLRVCFQPAQMLNYEIKNANFARPKGGLCQWRIKVDGSKYGPEFMYANVIPTWIQVAVNADVPKLLKPVAVQIYLDRPPANTSATKLQFIAEMLILNHKTGDRNIFRLKTPVYTIDYKKLQAGKWEYDPSKLVQAWNIPEIERSDDYYETDDSNKVCRETSPPIYPKAPYNVQQCACFKWTDGSNPIGSMMHPTSTIYHTHFKECIHYDWTTNVEPTGYQSGLYFYLTVWTRTSLERPVCGNFQVVGATLTPLVRIQIDKSTMEEIGTSFGSWIRTTVPIPGHKIVSTDPNFGRGLHCLNNTMYSGKLRRLPVQSEDYTTNCTKGGSQSGYLIPTGEKKLLLFYYPLMNQDDKGNSFCGGIKIAKASNNMHFSRFEFQITGYFFMKFTNPSGVNLYAMKRSPVFEYFENSNVTGNIQFPGQIFEIQNSSQVPTYCEVDICMFTP